MRKKAIVKLKVINEVNLNGEIKTKSIRFTMKISKQKIIKFLTKYNYQFKVGILDNKLIHNSNYIEVYTQEYWGDLIEDFLVKYSVKQNTQN